MSHTPFHPRQAGVGGRGWPQVQAQSCLSVLWDASEPPKVFQTAHVTAKMGEKGPRGSNMFSRQPQDDHKRAPRRPSTHQNECNKEETLHVLVISEISNISVEDGSKKASEKLMSI